ncbi:MAG: inner rane transporter RhtA [Pseudonocardiales bacterium]|nr:inner rane transporter RhtA [Mycobacterium sp.]MDT7596252.1 inner rane transporter RhtA [Pseudonocardiales bacterium]
MVGAAGLLLIRINSLQLVSAVAKDFFLTYFRAISRIPIGVAQAWNCLARSGYVLLNRRVGELFGDWSGLALALIAGAVVLTPIAAITSGEQLTHCDVLNRDLRSPVRPADRQIG